MDKASWSPENWIYLSYGKRYDETVVGVLRRLVLNHLFRLKCKPKSSNPFLN